MTRITRLPYHLPSERGIHSTSFKETSVSKWTFIIWSGDIVLQSGLCTGLFPPPDQGVSVQFPDNVFLFPCQRFIRSFFRLRVHPESHQDMVVVVVDPWTSLCLRVQSGPRMTRSWSLHPGSLKTTLSGTSTKTTDDFKLSGTWPLTE